MHQINVSRHLETPPLPPGVYLASDSTAAKMLAYNRGACKLSQPAFFQKELRSLPDLNGKTVLFVRQGAGGDILFCTPAIRELKKRHPFVSIDFSCLPRFHELLKHNPDIRLVINNPIEVHLFNSYDAVVCLEDHFEEEEKMDKEVHAVDQVLSHVGLSTEDKSLVYVVTPEEKERALIRFPMGSSKRRRIAIQIAASEPARNWPKENVKDFSMLAVKRGYDVFWVGVPGATGSGKTPPPEHLVDLTRCDPPLSIRESAALVSTCDGVVAPDSLWFHIASALKMPTVGLFAAFPSPLRVTNAETVTVVNGRVGCEFAPCFHHAGNAGDFAFPPAGPCAQVGHCIPMKEIAPDRVLSLLEKQMAKKEPSQ